MNELINHIDIGVDISGGVDHGVAVSKMVKFYVYFIYLMCKALCSELSCT